MGSTFSSDYREARQNFLTACEETGARVDNYRHPNTGPDERSLYTDVATFGREVAPATLVLQSGTHGVEGFAGSGIQVALIRRDIASRLPENVRAVFIHAINPYGFAYLRRVNEDNVDLNRNFVDHARPYPRNLAYEQLATAIAPVSFSLPGRIISIVRLLSYAAKNGKAGLRKAITEGQYSHPKGLCFGGNAPTWSNRTLREIAQQYLCSSKRIAFVDFHTGLGASGYGELIMNDPKGSPAYERAFEWWGPRVKSTKTGEALSADLSGTLKLAISGMAPNAEVTAASLEFGTVGSVRVFLALQAENWLHHFGSDEHPKSKSIKRALERAFYPNTERWKAAICSQAEQVVNEALDGIS